MNLRASKLDRILTCPGSLTIESLVAPRSGTEGDEGTYLHHRAHSALVKEHGAVGDPGAAIPTPKQAPLVNWIADYYVRHVVAATPAGWSLEVEAALEHAFARFTLTGHIDCVAMNADATEAMLFDLKTGRIAVDPAEYNNQLLAYAVLLRLAYPTLRRVQGTIIQPLNADEGDELRISDPMVLEGGRLEAAVAHLESEICKALDRPLDLDTSPKACRWCPAVLSCPAIRHQIDTMKLTMTKEQVAAIEAQPNDKLLADWVVAATILNAPMDAAKELAKERIKVVGPITSSDGKVVGTKVGPGAYSYPDPVGFFAKLRSVVPKDEDLARCVSFSLTKTRDVVAEVNQIPKTAKTGISAATIVDGHLKPLTEQGERTVFQILD